MSKINKKARLRAIELIHPFVREATNLGSDIIIDRDDFNEISDNDLVEGMRWVEDVLIKEIVKLKKP
jgi:hypothetical protein